MFCPRYLILAKMIIFPFAQLLALVVQRSANQSGASWRVGVHKPVTDAELMYVVALFIVPSIEINFRVHWQLLVHVCITTMTMKPCFYPCFNVFWLFP